MKITGNLLRIVTIAAFALGSCSQPKTEVRDDFKTYYDQFNVEGCFALYDQRQNKYLLYDPTGFSQPFIPASTFKICNSLIALETGVVTDADYFMPWDSITRGVAAWNRSHTLKSAFKNSVVWYYQEIARRVGEKDMKDWLEKAGYGNEDISGGIDAFWLSGGLRISPGQQIDFLKRLHENRLPFSQRSMDIVKDIMVVADTAGYVLRAKTGWSRQDNKDIGWYVGYLEKNENVYYFANCVRTPNENHPDFGRARLEIVHEILRRVGLLNK